LAQFASQASEANQQAADAQATGKLFGTIGGITGGLFTDSGGAETIFK
jgi:hypothetical protein